MARNKAGDTPYELATRVGQADVAKIFSDMGLGVEEEYAAQPAPDDPPKRASRSSRAGADIRAKDRRGSTPLMVAAAEWTMKR